MEWSKTQDLIGTREVERRLRRREAGRASEPRETQHWIKSLWGRSDNRQRGRPTDRLEFEEGGWRRRAAPTVSCYYSGLFFFFFLHGIWGSPRRGPKTYAACNAHLRGQQQGLQLTPRRGQGTEPGRLSPRAPRLARSQQTRAGGQGPGCHHLQIPDSLLPTSLFQRPPPSGRQASS